MTTTLGPGMALPEKIPQARDRLEHDVDGTAPRVKVALSLDRSGTKVCRAQGRGDQDRLNRILVPTAQRTSPG